MKAYKHVIFTHVVSDLNRASSSDFGHLQQSAAWVRRRLAAQREAKKQNSMTTVKPWPILNWATWFTVSHGVLRLQSPLQLL